MNSREVFALLTTSLFGSVCSVSKSVKYEGPPGTISNKIGCAAMSTDPSIVAVRIYEETGTCQGLTWNDWGTNPTYENGYTYFDKQRTFKNPNSLSLPFITDLNNGNLADGKTIHVEGIPTAGALEFNINLQHGNGIAIHINVRFNFEGQENVMVINDRYNWIWGIQKNFFSSSFPFSIGVPYKITIRYQQNTFKVAVNYTHFADFEARSSPLDHIDTLQIHSHTRLTKVVVKW